MKLESCDKQVHKTEARWTEAFLQSDINTLEQLMDDSYIQVQADGSVKTKAEVLASFETNERHWDIAQSDEHHLTLYNDTAVLIGRWRAKGVNHGQTFDYSARFVSVYVKRVDGWKIVSDQATEIKNKS